MNINNQKISKQVLDDGYQLPVNEMFETMQGEGPLQGFPATFIRLAGCNLCCKWCDTEYTTYTKKSVEWLSQNCLSPLVVITGGEPLIHNVVPLVKALAENGKTVQIETNGTLWIPGLDQLIDDDLVIVVCSPKTRNIHPKMLEYFDKDGIYIKQVVGVEAFPSQPDNKGGIPAFLRPEGGLRPDFIMPCDTGDPHLTTENVNHAMRIAAEFNTCFQLQIHKLLGLK